MSNPSKNTQVSQPAPPYPFEQVRACSPYHVQIRHKGVALDHWPSKGKWCTWGQTFKADVEEVLRLVEAGIFRPPHNAYEHRCLHCGNPFYWVRTKKGKWQPTSLDGLWHNCREKRS